MQLKICKRYLDLSNSFELPEEKQMEVTRLIKKMENAQATINQEKTKAEQSKALMISTNEVDKKKTMLIESLIFKMMKIKPRIPLEELVLLRPDVKGFLKHRNKSDI